MALLVNGLQDGFYTCSENMSMITATSVEEAARQFFKTLGCVVCNNVNKLKVAEAI